MDASLDLERRCREDLAELEGLVGQHTRWRRRCINLCAAENAPGPRVLAMLGSELAERYADYLGRDLTARKYYGTRYVAAIEERVERLAQELFHAPHVELRALSGHVAGAAVIMAATRPGDAVLEPGSDGGGHRLASKLLSTRLADLRVHFLAVDAEAYNLDFPAARALIRATRPRLVILGSSNFLFPHPVAEVAAALKAEVPDAILAYDASHVLGLIAGGQFQDPLAEGADVVFASSHKTFPGPPGAVIFSRRADVMEAVSAAVYPGLVTNHHPARLPALGIALLEMKLWGQAYAAQVVANAQALAAALAGAGLPVVGAGQGYTRSHTVLVRVAGSAAAAAARLEAAGLIVNAVRLPAPPDSDGLRLGVQESTRLGMGPTEMKRIAAWMAALLTGSAALEAVRSQVEALAARHQQVRYAFPIDRQGGRDLRG